MTIMLIVLALIVGVLLAVNPRASNGGGPAPS